MALAVDFYSPDEDQRVEMVVSAPEALGMADPPGGTDPRAMP